MYCHKQKGSRPVISKQYTYCVVSFKIYVCGYVCLFISNADHETVLFSELSDIWPGSEPEGLRQGSEVVGRERRGEEDGVRGLEGHC